MTTPDDHLRWKRPLTGIDVELERDGFDYWIVVNGKRLFGRDPSVHPLCSADLVHLDLIDVDTAKWWFEDREFVNAVREAAPRPEEPAAPAPPRPLCGARCEVEPYAGILCVAPKGHAGDHQGALPGARWSEGTATYVGRGMTIDAAYVDDVVASPDWRVTEATYEDGVSVRQRVDPEYVDRGGWLSASAPGVSHLVIGKDCPNCGTWVQAAEVLDGGMLDLDAMRADAERVTATDSSGRFAGRSDPEQSVAGCLSIDGEDVTTPGWTALNSEEWLRATGDEIRRAAATVGKPGPERIVVMTPQTGDPHWSGPGILNGTPGTSAQPLIAGKFEEQHAPIRCWVTDTDTGAAMCTRPTAAVAGDQFVLRYRYDGQPEVVREWTMVHREHDTVGPWWRRRHIERTRRESRTTVLPLHLTLTADPV